GEGLTVLRHLPLRDDALLVGVHELNGFLDCNDVPGEIAVNIIDERGEGGGFARARGASDQYKTASKVSEFLDHGRESEFVQRRDLCRNKPEHGAVSADLLEEIATEPAFLVHFISHV